MEVKIIRFMRHNPFMYNRKHSSYRDQILKEAKWKQLSQETNVPIVVLKRRWKSLRDRFFRLLKTDISSRLKYKYYTNLLFLCDAGESTNKTNIYEIKEEAFDNDRLTKSEDSFLLDQASFSSFHSNDKKSPTPASMFRMHSEDVREVSATESNPAQNLTPFRLFLESIALTIENANFNMNEVMRLQMNILELVQNEMNNRNIDN